MRFSYRSLATALGVALIAAVPALGFQSRAEAHAGPDVASASFVSWQPRIEGQPYFFSAGSAPGIYFWHNEPAGLSLRTTDPPGVSHEYSGVITTDGTIINLHPYELESDDSYNLGPMGHVLTFDFHTDSAIDGLDFEIAAGTGVKLGAQMDGMSIPLSNIYLGEAGVNPINNPLWVCREDNGACLANLP